MVVGISTANLSHPTLNWLRGVAPAAIPGLWVKLHTGDPGAAGTANASAVTTRQQVTMTAPAGGQITLDTVGGSWAMTASETISHLSVHTDSGAGNFLWSVAVTTPRAVLNGDTLTLVDLVMNHSPLAA